MYVDIFIYVYTCRLFPLPENFIRGYQTVDHYMPVDTDSAIHNMMVELVYSYNWCTGSEHNFTKSASKKIVDID
jgi:hypothetical protein